MKDRARTCAAYLCCTGDDVTSLVKPEWVYLNQEIVLVGQTGHHINATGLKGGGGGGEGGQGELSATCTRVPWKPIKWM